MKNISLLILLVAGITFTACESKQENASQEPSETVSTQSVPGPGKVTLMSSKELHSWFEREREVKFSVLDVRTPEEFATGSLPGAQNVDFLTEEFKTKASQLDKETTWVVVCQAGKRSSTAAQQLIGMGFRQVWSLDGGLDAWTAEGYSLAR